MAKILFGQIVKYTQASSNRYTRGGGQALIQLHYGPEYISKDMLFFVQKSFRLFIGFYVNRIEYGSLVSGERLKMDLVDEYGTVGYTSSEYFLQGNCSFMLSLWVCQLCLMHQYELHRTYNNTAKICSSFVNPDPSEMKKCYWEEPTPLPEYLKGYDIDTSNLNLKIPVCEDLPQDVKDYLSNKGTTSTSTISTTDTPIRKTPQPKEYSSFDYGAGEAQTLIAGRYFVFYVSLHFKLAIYNFFQNF